MKRENKYFILILSVLLALPFVIYSYYLTPPSVQEVRIETNIQYQGLEEGDYSDYITLSAHLTEKESGNPLSNKTVKFILGNQEASATTNDQGIAQVDLKINQSSGTYNLLSIFEGDDMYNGSSDTEEFTIQKEDTSITYTGPTSGTEDSTITLSAALSEIDQEQGDLSEKSIRFKLGALSATATTNSLGKASTSLKLNISPGNYTLKIEFLGDGYYLPSSTTKNFEVEEKPGYGGGGDHRGGCFIATAAYGSSLAQEIAILRSFRDKYLEKSSAGREFVRLYYTYSPPIAARISQSPVLRIITRMGLNPIITIVKNKFF
ncbi:MAG: CFI-box-CTERM domain-containing protein [Candidatus Omnitrophota bacterium]